MNVAEYITDFFIKKNIRHVFGLQGGAILKLLDTMISSGKIRYIQNYHEQASSFCADAYARITGDVGVAVATSGPGATNLINGIANAYLDSIPCVFITGQYHSTKLKTSDDIRMNGFQDLDIVSMVRPITKYAVTLMAADAVRYELEKCYYLARSGRPGSVLLDIPIDIQFAEVDEESLKGYIPEKEEAGELHKTIDLIRLLKGAKRPLILAGGGVRISGAGKAFEEFLRLTGIPAVTTLNGLDVDGKTHSFSGLYGNTYANLAVDNADLLMVMGARLGQHQVVRTKAEYTRAAIVHIDIDNHELGRAVAEDLSIRADLKQFLDALNREVATTELPDITPWLRKIEEWEEKYAECTHLEKDFLDPVRAVKALSRFFTSDAIITSDVGQNQMWVAQGLMPLPGQRVISSSGFGSMGYSLPAAIGVKTAKPEAQVVAFTGDGGLQMNIQELLYVSRKQLNIKCVVFNNNTLGLIKYIQDMYFDGNYVGTSPDYFSCADLKLLAGAYGIEYRKVSSCHQVEDLKDALADDKPYIIELILNNDSKLLNRFQQDEIFKSERIHER